MKQKRLGRGLSGLISRTSTPNPVPSAAHPAAPPTPVAFPQVPPGISNRMLGQLPPAVAAALPPESEGVRGLPVAAIKPNPYQPRTAFDEAALRELADSIRAHGVLQPIVVRRALGGYEVLAGERRLRAAKAAGLETIPAMLREATDEEMQTLALVENLQREDLNAMEKARALRAMMSNFGLTQDQVATRVGKARPTIANILRLLELGPEIQRWVEEGRLSGAHARAVLLAKGPERRLLLAKLAVELGLSVREVERRAASEGGVSSGKAGARLDPFLADLAKRLERALSTNVRLRPKGKGGKIEIRYHDAADLDRLLDILKA